MDESAATFTLKKRLLVEKDNNFFNKLDSINPTYFDMKVLSVISPKSELYNWYLLFVFHWTCDRAISEQPMWLASNQSYRKTLA